MQFVRAPDENVFIPPLNLVELVLLIAPLEWWLPRALYARVNDLVMLVLYSPLLLVTAALETRQARAVCANRAHRRGGDDGDDDDDDDDDDDVHEWERLDLLDGGGDGAAPAPATPSPGSEADWLRQVEQTKPDVELDGDGAAREVKKLRSELADVHALLTELKDAVAPAPGNGSASASASGFGWGSGSRHIQGVGPADAEEDGKGDQDTSAAEGPGEGQDAKGKDGGNARAEGQED